MRVYACIIGCLLAMSMMAAPPRMRDGIVPQDSGVRSQEPHKVLRVPQAIGKINLAPRGLVILVSYSDLAFEVENDSAAMSDMLNKEGYNYNGATGSARDYFIAQSNGTYTPEFDVVGPVTLTHERAFYGGNIGGRGTDKNPQQMIVDACQAVDTKVNFAQYDNDDDGKIDFVYVLFAGIGENDINGEPDAIWPHNSSVSGKGCYLDGKLLDNYACSGEINGNIHARNGIGTICHEFGHVIGLPDYYDTTPGGGTNWDEGVTPNNWSVMDQGCYNNEGNTPPNYSIFDKYFMGWATPQFLAKDAARTITMGTDYDEGYQISGGDAIVPFSCTDSVYYIENRQPAGWDAYLPGHGMIVWRVVYDASAWNGNTLNKTARKPRLTLIAADGSTVIGSIAELNHTGKADPFPGEAEIHSWTAFEGCVLTGIEEISGAIRFKFNGGEPETSVESQEVRGKSQKMLKNGQLIIIRGNQIYDSIGQLINN